MSTRRNCNRFSTASMPISTHSLERLFACCGSVDLGRSGLCRRLQGGGRSSCQGYRVARLRDGGPADGRSSRHRRQNQWPWEGERATTRAVLWAL